MVSTLAVVGMVTEYKQKTVIWLTHDVSNTKKNSERWKKVFSLTTKEPYNFVSKAWLYI